MPEVGSQVVMEWGGLVALVALLRADGYRVVGPRIRDGAIVLDELSSATDLPVGWGDEQDGGVYRLRRREDAAAFGYAVGPQSWRRFLSPPRELLWRASKSDGGFSIEERSWADEGAPAGARDGPYAFLGVRACDLRAMEAQDRVFAEGTFPDPAYRARRDAALIIAVNCTEPGGTCFCTSMGTGPRASAGFDLSLTEVDDGQHRFLVEVGTEAGAALVQRLEHRPAGEDDVEGAALLVDAAATRMGRSMDPTGLRELLAQTLEHPHWDDVAERCLGCANCTLVCPTCFCSTVEDTTDVTGDHAERWKRWDSCFTADFSYIHGGSVRPSTKSRYRQWLTHKLGTWYDQFGTSGCVGCGRCVTWCPVGIDLTAEIAALRLPPTGSQASQEKGIGA